MTKDSADIGFEELHALAATQNQQCLPMSA